MCLYCLQQLSSRVKRKTRVVLLPFTKTIHNNGYAESDEKSLQLNILSSQQVPKQTNKKVYKQGKHYKEIFQLNYFCWRGQGKESDPDIAAKEKITEIEDW